MKRILTIALLPIIAAMPLAAQTPAAPAATKAATGAVPAGWKFREDKSASATDPDGAGSIKILTAGTGYHVETPTAAVFWNPANTATGNYTLKGTFTLNKLSTHTNYFGLVIGGSDLDNAKQKYTYFMVSCQPDAGRGQAQNAWLIKSRNGDASVVTTFTGLEGQLRSGGVQNSVVKMPDANGKSTNTLEVRVQATKIDFVVNGTVVHSAPRASVGTDGIWGFRSNHFLDINVDSLTLTKQ